MKKAINRNRGGGSNLKKGLGQNFLRDTQVISQIITISELSPADVVVEVGPGDGSLTEALLATGARVICLEIDGDLIAPLQEKFGEKDNFFLLHEDVRRFNLAQYLSDHDIEQYKVVANLPYYITSSIIRMFLDSEAKPSDMTLMVQKEVGQRICAQPGSLSILGVSVQYYGAPSLEIIVPAIAFEPAPKVDSAVIRVTQITSPLSKQGEKHFFRVVRAGFSARRKMLAKNLSNSFALERAEVVNLMIAAGIKETARPQELTLDQWHELSSSLKV